VELQNTSGDAVVYLGTLERAAVYDEKTGVRVCAFESADAARIAEERLRTDVTGLGEGGDAPDQHSANGGSSANLAAEFEEYTAVSPLHEETLSSARGEENVDDLLLDERSKVAKDRADADIVDERA
jgi:hypothetical protein